MSLGRDIESLERALNALTLADLAPIPQEISATIPDIQPPAQTFFTSSPHHRPNTAISPRSSRTFPDQRPHSHPGQTTPLKADSRPPDATAILAGAIGGIMERLWLLDEQLDSHIKTILLELETLASPDNSKQAEVFARLVEERVWLRDSLHAVDQVQIYDDACGQMLKDAMLERLSSFVESLDDYIGILQDRSSPDMPIQQHPAKKVNNGIPRLQHHTA